MFGKTRISVAAVAGLVSLAAVGTMPALAAVPSCPTGTAIYVTGTTVYVNPESATADTVWSQDVTVTAYCGSATAGNELQNAVIKVYGASESIDPLYASIDNSFPSIKLPVQPATMFGTPSGSGIELTPVAPLSTDASGNVHFRLRLTSPTTPNLMGAAGPTPIGMSIDVHPKIIVGTGGAPDQTVYTGGFGQVMATTPELDSLALFGTGAAGMAGYALMRLRARRSR